MTDLPTAYSWDDIQPGIEYATDPEHPLTGWRIGAVVMDRTFGGPLALRVFPFARTEYARNNHCHNYPAKNPESWHNRRVDDPNDLHTGEKVHPECACGFHVVRTQQMAAEFATEAGHASLQRKIVRKSNVHWIGMSLCKVSTYYGAHVTGPNLNADIGDIDPPGTLRTNALQLDAIYVPEGLARHAGALFDHYERFGVDTYAINGSITDELECES